MTPQTNFVCWQICRLNEVVVDKILIQSEAFKQCAILNRNITSDSMIHKGGHHVYALYPNGVKELVRGVHS
mgnify:CR=1 FL=1